MPNAAALQFACKTVLGAELALWFAMQLGLSQPLLAMMTAIIVAQPLSGMVMQKGLARLAGTLVGMAMSLVLMRFFAPMPWLFLLLLSLWMGLCTAASTLLRSAWAYAFVLAGYTVAIICLPVMAHPLAVLDHALQRGAEIGLGVICATAMSAFFWPQKVEQQLLLGAREAWSAGLSAASALLRGESYERRPLLDTLSRVVAVDAQREHAWFEGRTGQLRAAAVRVFSRDLLTMLRLARGVGRQWRLLNPEQAHAMAPWLDEFQQLLRQAEMGAFEAFAARLQGAAEAPELQPVEKSFLARMALLQRLVLSGYRSLQAVVRGDAPAEPASGMSWHRDGLAAAFCGLRSATACGLLGVAWLLSGWPVLIGALIVTSVICSLFASRENATQLGFGFLYGTLMAIPVAFVVGQLVLPSDAAYGWTALALGVPLFLGALGMTRPAYLVVSIAFSLHFLLLSAPQAGHRITRALFLDETLALLLGIACAILAFKLIALRNPGWHGRRLLKAMLDDLARLAVRDLQGAENWFGGRMADRMLKLAQHFPDNSPATRNPWNDGVRCLDLADELLHLRRCLPPGDVRVDKALQAFLDSFVRCIQAEPSLGLADVLDQPVARLTEVLSDDVQTDDRNLARAALVQLQQGWRQWCLEQAAGAGTESQSLHTPKVDL